jgi:hypothetical protein
VQEEEGDELAAATGGRCTVREIIRLEQRGRIAMSRNDHAAPACNCVVGGGGERKTGHAPSQRARMSKQRRPAVAQLPHPRPPLACVVPPEGLSTLIFRNRVIIILTARI